MARSSSQKSIILYAILTLVFLIICFALVGVFIYKAQYLISMGISGNIFYIILVPLALAASLCLFGALKSHATFKGNVQNGGVLRLSGPVVLFLLILLGGFKLVPKLDPFDFTVFLFDENGNSVSNLNGNGILYLENDKRISEINDNHFDFKGIPQNFRGDSVKVELNLENWNFANGNSNLFIPLGGKSIDLKIKRKDKCQHIYGRVINKTSGLPIDSVLIQINKDKTYSMNDGNYELTISDNLEKYTLKAFKKGFMDYPTEVYPCLKDEANIQMEPK